jgi:hypothetical protein
VALVVDDLLLLTSLAGGASDELNTAMRDAELFTTSSWYCRLARATRDEGFSGALSSAVEALPSDERGLVHANLDRLPRSIGLVDTRRLVPVMARLDVPTAPQLLDRRSDRRCRSPRCCHQGDDGLAVARHCLPRPRDRFASRHELSKRTRENGN